MSSQLGNTLICGDCSLSAPPWQKNTPATTSTTQYRPGEVCRTSPAVHFSVLQAFRPPTPHDRSQNAWIHQHSVSKYLEQAPSNSILESPPPPINPVEASLPRADHIHLSHLRSGHHPAILTYEARLCPDTDPACRWCQSPPESVPHLFQECTALVEARRAHGITTVRDLWDSSSPSLGFLREVGVLQPTHIPAHTHVYRGSPPPPPPPQSTGHSPFQEGRGYTTTRRVLQFWSHLARPSQKRGSG